MTLKRKHKTYDDIRRKSDIRRQSRLSAPQKDWWWVSGQARVGKTGMLKSVLFGEYATEEEAWRKGYELCDGNFEVVLFPTKTTNEANRMNRMRLANKGQSLGDVLGRVRHQGKDIGVE